MRVHGQVLLPRRLLAVAATLACLCGQSSSQPTTTSSTHLTNPQTGVCDFKTINYITHTLPQQCLRTSWPGDKGATNTNGTTSIHDVPNLQENRTTDTVACGQVTSTPDAAADTTKGDLPPPTTQDTSSEEEPSPRPFISFEDWKEMMLRKAGQDPSELRTRKTYDRATEHERATKSSGLDSLGDDGEIDLNFDVVSEKISNIASAPQAPPTETAASELQEPVLYDDGRTQYYRSKDAGKTCKERFSYSSFDAGATVLKTNRGAKNSKAILLENKDSYMLLECAAENKFVIVELSDDILVDTIVLANFEFFSSMIRQFRVSVSDRYPVKADKWKDLGTFEARNSRDIQPFLVPNPLIWAKYVRIEFLSHYGKEYYCPVSLLRVHGTRMLESWKDTEAPADEEDATDESHGELPGSGPVTETKPVDSPETQENASVASIADMAEVVRLNISVDPSLPSNVFWPLGSDNFTCSKYTTLAVGQIPEPSAPGKAHRATQTEPDHAVHGGTSRGSSNAQSAESRPSSAASTAPSQPQASVVQTAASSASAGAHHGNSQSDSRSSPGEDTNSGSPPIKATSQGSAQSRTKVNSTAAPASQTVQESFFKAVSKRLQYLEANVSLSLKYIEDQSRSLQETQHLAERKQLSRIDVFLDSLNDTVLSELRIVRQQYEQIWQSTVIALESQREQSQRDTVALSSRLNILAEEVVFQKRMAIVQAILLLSCLVLVIFSRAITQPILTNSFELGRPPGLNHPLPGLPADREPDSAFTPRYDKLGRPFGAPNGDGDRLDTSPGPGLTSSAAPRHLLTPDSDDVRRSGEGVSASGYLAGDPCVKNDTDTSYHSSSGSPATPSPDERGYIAAEEDLMDHSCPIQDSNQMAGIVPEASLDSRFPPQTRVITSASRKPLPALPE